LLEFTTPERTGATILSISELPSCLEADAVCLVSSQPFTRTAPLIIAQGQAGQFWLASREIGAECAKRNSTRD
jgi:hypothetical protein